MQFSGCCCPWRILRIDGLMAGWMDSGWWCALGLQWHSLSQLTPSWNCWSKKLKSCMSRIWVWMQGKWTYGHLTEIGWKCEAASQEMNESELMVTSIPWQRMVVVDEVPPGCQVSFSVHPLCPVQNWSLQRATSCYSRMSDMNVSTCAMHLITSTPEHSSRVDMSVIWKLGHIWLWQNDE